jgi:hypothetical protein
MNTDEMLSVFWSVAQAVTLACRLRLLSSSGCATRFTFMAATNGCDT